MMASVRKSHFVVLPTSDGSVSVAPMKEWLRQHPEHVAEGLDATQSTSQQLRAGLKKQGWSLQETESEFRLLPPGALSEGNPAVRAMLEAQEEADPADVADREDASFSLESQLEDFLAANLQHIPIDGNRLSVYVDPTGREGVQYPTAVGPIDILAVDRSSNFYVLELKRGRSPDATLGQVTRYMGWVSRTIGKECKVFGVIVAKQISTSLRYAACVVPNVSLLEYEVSFTLRAAEEISDG
jgi:hypothetical protein